MLVKIYASLLLTSLALAGPDHRPVLSIHEMNQAAVSNRNGLFEVHATALKTIEGMYLTNIPCDRCGDIVGFDIDKTIKNRPEVKTLYKNLGLANQNSQTLYVTVLVKPTAFVQKKMPDSSSPTFVTDVVVMRVDDQLLK